jgi:hypothetical protein
MLSKLGLSEIPEKSVLLIEEDLGDVKRIFVQRIGLEAAEAGKEVVFITPRLSEDVTREMSAQRYSEHLEIVERFRDRSRLLDVCGGDICIIESFAMLIPCPEPPPETMILVPGWSSMYASAHASAPGRTVVEP